MVRRKQFLAILTVCTMLFGLTGCQGDVGAESVDTDQTTHITTMREQIIDSETELFQSEISGNNADLENDKVYAQELENESHVVPIEKDVIDDVTKNDSSEADIIRSCLYVDGKQVTLPCTLAEFGEGFEIRDDISEDNSPRLVNKEYDFDEDGNAIPAYQGSLWYNDVSWGMITYTIADNGEQVIWSILIAAWYSDNDYSRLKVNNEVYLGGDYSDLTEIKGISYDHNTSLGLTLCTASDNTYNTKLSINVIKDNIVGTICVSVHPENNK